MKQDNDSNSQALSRREEEAYLRDTLKIVHSNIDSYRKEAARMQGDIKEMLDHYHDNDDEVYTILSNTITMHEHMKRALVRNEKAAHKPYFGRIIFHDETLDKDESIYIGKGGISKDTTHWMVVDWRAPVANVYYENGLGSCSYLAPNNKQILINLKKKRTYEIEEGKLLDFFDTEVVANDELLTKYLAKNKQAVLGEIIATIQKEQNDIIRKSPYHNIIVQGVAGSGKTTVAMHRISYILYNYQERFRPDDFYIIGSNRILLNYITGVLPDLDVYGIRQMTMEQLFVRLLYEDWDEEKYRITETAKMSPKSICKGTLQWFLELEEFCRKLEWDTIPRATIFLNPKQFVEGIRGGKTGVFDETNGQSNPKDLRELVPADAIERYIRQNPAISVQSKINMLNERLLTKIKDEFLGKDISYTEKEQKAILKAYRGRYGEKNWKQSIFELYHAFLYEQARKGYDIEFPTDSFDVYDLAALAYIYKRIKETEVISEAHHVVIDEAQDFGMMAYAVLKFCMKDCTYTIMGDISQNIHFGYGLKDWEELKQLLLPNPMDNFGILKKSYRNTIEISEFATNILHHGQFSIYPVEPIIRHGNPVRLIEAKERASVFKEAASICKDWQHKGFETIAIVCRNQANAQIAASELSRYIPVMACDLETAVFGNGIMVLPVEYTKGLEFDAVLILSPTKEEYPLDDGHAKLLYVAATRALHELCILHEGNLTGLITEPLPETLQNAPLKTLTKASPKTTQNMPLKTRANSLPKTAQATKTPDKKKIIIARGQNSQATNQPVQPPKQPSQTIASAGAKQPASDIASAGTKQPASNITSAGAKKPIPGIASAGAKRPTSDIASADAKKPIPDIAFGDMPSTEKLRPAGHSKIDLAIRWCAKQPDGLYLQSRYGILRLCPIGSAIVRVTFAKGTQLTDETNGKIAVHYVDKTWMYRESGANVELMTDEICLQIDKANGSIRYLTRNKKLLLAERIKECRQIESGLDKNIPKTWLFLDWQKNENIYGMGTRDTNGMKLRGSARYISHGKNAEELPFLLSDKGYGILMATDAPTMCCDIPTYGSYLHTEGDSQIDYYFITGKQPNTILNAYGYLCGRL